MINCNLLILLAQSPVYACVGHVAAASRELDILPSQYARTANDCNKGHSTKKCRESCTNSYRTKVSDSNPAFGLSIISTLARVTTASAPLYQKLQKKNQGRKHSELSKATALDWLQITQWFIYLPLHPPLNPIANYSMLMTHFGTRITVCLQLRRVNLGVPLP